VAVKELRLNAEEMEQVRKLRVEYKESVRRLVSFGHRSFYNDVRDRRDRAIRSLVDDGFTIEQVARIFRIGKKTTEAVVLDVRRMQEE
jgi:hypothetical protein